MSAMIEAFEDAGYVNIDERLAKIAIDAWALWPNTNDGAYRRAYVAERLAGSLAWALWKQWDHKQIVMAIGKLLNDTKPIIETQQPRKGSGHKPADGGGHAMSDTQARGAPVVTSLSDAGVGRRSTEATGTATPSSTPPPAPTQRAGTNKAKEVVTRSLSALDTVFINAQPIRRLTVLEARKWALTHHQKARFVDMVTANMADHWIIGEHMTDDLANELLHRVEAEHAE